MMDYKQRLYERYSTHHVQVTPATVRDSLGKAAPLRRSFIRRWVPADRNARILDLGCGYGSMLHFLRERGYRNLLGVDGSEEQVAIAHHLGFPDVQCCGVAEFLGALPANSVDVVIAMAILEHLTRDELFDIGDQLSRVLKPGGWLAIHVPNGGGLFYGRDLYGDLTHETAFTPRSLQQFGNACGLTLTRVTEDPPIPHGVLSLGRYLVWKAVSPLLRLVFMASCAAPYSEAILTPNLQAGFQKPG